MLGLSAQRATERESTMSNVTLTGTEPLRAFTPPMPSVSGRSASRLARSVNAVAGLVLLAVGVPILLDPLAYAAGMDLRLPSSPTLLSDMRAMAAALVGFALLHFVGASRAALSRTAATAGAVLYLSYGSARLFSLAVDGLPAPALVFAAGIELLIGGSLALVVFRSGRAAQSPHRA